MNKILKKIICIIAVGGILLTSINAFAVADVIKINGVEAEIPDGMGKIRESDNRTFVPLRFVSEFLNNTVWYDEETKTACVSSGEQVIFAQNGNSTLFISMTATGESRSIEMDTSAFIDATEGRTYVPIRYLAEALGYEVGWDEVTQTVTLDKKSE